MATLQINTGVLQGGQRQPWSPLTSPVAASSPADSLSARCRALAYRFGHEAVQDDPSFTHSSNQSDTPPNRSSPQGSPGRSPRTASSPSSSAFSPLISPRSTHSQLHPPPVDEGSHILDGIMEEAEGEGTPRAELPVTSLDFGSGSGGEAASLGEGEPAYGKSAGAEDQASSNSLQEGFAAGWTSSFGGAAALLQEEEVQQHSAEAVIEEQVAALRQALKEGTTWIAADIYLVDGELLVGPTPGELEPSKTFSDCFVEPLLCIFQGSSNLFGTAHRRRSSVFDHVSPHHPFQLVVRLHTPPSMTFPYLVDALEPLHHASLLTTYCPNADVSTPALITVVSSAANGAEMVPLEDLTSVPCVRFVYRDADISMFDGDDEPQDLSNNLTPVAAGNLKDATGWNGQCSPTDEQKEKISAQVGRAHKRGLKVRYEGLPQFPVHIRENVKHTLHMLGVDYL
ncbi:hypothetical protein JCM11251_004800 [Rhodosporidiobolus azoricus]